MNDAIAVAEGLWMYASRLKAKMDLPDFAFDEFDFKKLEDGIQRFEKKEAKLEREAAARKKEEDEAEDDKKLKRALTDAATAFGL